MFRLDDLLTPTLFIQVHLRLFNLPAASPVHPAPQLLVLLMPDTINILEGLYISSDYHSSLQV